MHIPAPIKVATPYGGRLEWRMPGGNIITAHLKDKVKIRHKKRWSQVHYHLQSLTGVVCLSDHVSMKREWMDCVGSRTGMFKIVLN